MDTLSNIIDDWNFREILMKWPATDYCFEGFWPYTHVSKKTKRNVSTLKPSIPRNLFTINESPLISKVIRK